MTQIRLSSADYLVVGGYFVIVLWIGFYFRKRLTATRDYFAGGNQIPWWLAGISHYMSSFSAFAFVAYAQMAYQYGWVSVTLFWGTIPGCLAGGLFFARRWRRARVVTPVEFLEARFNPLIRQLFAWAGIPMKVFDDALKVFATGLFVSVSAGVDLTTAILVCGGVMLAYTFLGGLWALVVTDYVQFLMKALAILLLFPLAIIGAGGWSRAFSGLPPTFFRINGGPFGWFYIAGFAVFCIISYNASWSLAQKYYSVPTEKDAAKAAFCAAALNLVGAPLMIVPAMIARKLLPDLIAQGHTADTYVLLVMKLLPAGMVGIIMAAMFSATMAAVSADFNAIASVLTKDVYHRLFRPRSTETQLVQVGRFVTLGLGALTVGLSLWIAASQSQSLFGTMITVLGLFMAPTFLPLLAGLTVRRLTWPGALCGFLGGLGTGAVMLALKTWWLPAHPGVFASSYQFEGITLLANAAATMLGMALGSIVWPKQSPRAFEVMDHPLEASEVPQRGSNPAAPALGASTIAVGLLLVAAGLISGSSMALWIDLGIGTLLCAVGASFFWRRGAKSSGVSA